MTLPLDGSIEATFEDGFVLSETETGDVSPFNAEHNILRCIINKDAESSHGRLVEVSLFYRNKKYTVDFMGLPENARPIRFKHMERQSVGGEWITDPYINRIDFGYQFTDENGKNIQEVITL